jgi:hypothetical protein
MEMLDGIDDGYHGIEVVARVECEHPQGQPDKNDQDAR